MILISHDAKSVVAFRMPTDAEPQEPELVDFTLARGALYVLARDHRGQPWLLRYDRDGEFKTASELDVQIDAMQIEATASGDLLVVGRDSHTGADFSARFVGLFSNNGQLLRRLRLRNDVPPPKAGAVRHSRRNHQFDTALRASVLQAGLDGNIYLMRRAPSGPVFVISPGGLIRKVNLHPPAGAVNGGKLAVGSGQFAVEFLKFKSGSSNSEVDSVIIVVFDSFTGQVVKTFSHSDPEIGAALACYDGKSIVFVNTDDNSHLQLIEAKPQ